jgi:hypothetical protein
MIVSRHKAKTGYWAAVFVAEQLARLIPLKNKRDEIGRALLSFVAWFLFRCWFAIGCEIRFCHRLTAGRENPGHSRRRLR